MKHYYIDQITFSTKKGLWVSLLFFASLTVFFMFAYHVEFKPSNYFAMYNLKNDNRVIMVKHQTVSIHHNDTHIIKTHEDEERNKKADSIIVKKGGEKSKRLNKRCDRMFLKVNYSKPSIAASFGRGRTANQLCYFAAGYALWRQYGILNFIDKTQLDFLNKTFVLPELDDDGDSSPYYLWREGIVFGSA